MRNYSNLLFLSSVLAADNNTLAHMAQEHLPVQERIISLFFASIVGAGLAPPCYIQVSPALLHPGLPAPLNIQVRTIDLSLSPLNAIVTN